MFEQATRMKLRFNFKGQITVEDLWELRLVELDNIFKALNSQAKTQKEESLLDRKTKEDEELDLKMKIIRHVVETKQQERKERLDANAKAEKKKKLLGIIAEKQDAALRDMSVEDLTKLVDEL